MNITKPRPAGKRHCGLHLRGDSSRSDLATPNCVFVLVSLEKPFHADLQNQPVLFDVGHGHPDDVVSDATAEEAAALGRVGAYLRVHLGERCFDICWQGSERPDPRLAR